ncbi:pentatricopeptide repeat-containing protein At1g08070, chloroplastic-like [Aristolochia californica]|uniref:pentatricopeptide repeat-containing protein At1g08070, chloroplastic-like n=1 Tax=Aristolochia californica TaxID=171875 RepID=UPI0035E24F67
MSLSGITIQSLRVTHRIKSVLVPGGGNISDALNEFHQLPNPSTYLWNNIIRACSAKNAPGESISLYLQMRQKGVAPDTYTFQFLFKACSKVASVRTGQSLHADFIKRLDISNVFMENSLVHMYTEFGQIADARLVFYQMYQKNVVSWTTVIGGYAKIGEMEEALQLFDEMPERNVVSWTSMIAGYAQNGQPEEAIGFFKKMVSAGVKLDGVAVVSVLTACAQMKVLDIGMWIHDLVKRDNIPMSSKLAVALVDMYAKCGETKAAHSVFESMDQKVLPAWNALIDGYCKLGDLTSARSLFDQMDEQDIITFNSMIIGYIHVNCFKEALLLFPKLQALDLKPDQFTVVGLLTACSNLGALDQGKLLHAYIQESFIHQDVILGTALADMYSKCGRIDQSLLVFNRMSQKDVLSWSAIISGLAIHGQGKLALALFSSMQKEGLRPNKVTYIGVLCACSHSGLVEEGLVHFREMLSVYNIQPEIEHYGCMVDVLGRAGLLKEAEHLVQQMPMEPNAIIWASLLGASKVHNDVALAEKAAKHLLVLEPLKDGAYVLLFNVYARLGRWADAVHIRSMMEGRGIRKTAGCSSIVVGSRVHEFVSGDRSHPLFEDIQLMINEISKKLKLAGYVPSTSEVSLDLDEEEKENALLTHSEKMAIAFGIMKIGATLPLLVIKNLRVCCDCHSAIKLIAKIWNREIVVRDRARFHHFREGKCSCNDFW